MISKNLMTLCVPVTLEQFVEYLLPMLPLQPISLQWDVTKKNCCILEFLLKSDVYVYVEILWNTKLVRFTTRFNSNVNSIVRIEDPLFDLEDTVWILQCKINQKNYILTQVFILS